MASDVRRDDPIAYGWTKADGVTPFMQHDGMPLVNYWPPRSDVTKSGGNALVPLYSADTVDALRSEVSRLREALNRCRPAVVAWQAFAGVGEIAESVRVPFRATPKTYAERQREAGELLNIIDGEPIFHLRSYGDVTADELKALTKDPAP